MKREESNVSTVRVTLTSTEFINLVLPDVKLDNANVSIIVDGTVPQYLSSKGSVVVSVVSSSVKDSKETVLDAVKQ